MNEFTNCSTVTAFIFLSWKNGVEYQIGSIITLDAGETYEFAGICELHGPYESKEQAQTESDALQEHYDQYIDNLIAAAEMQDEMREY